MSEPIATERYRLALIAHHAETLAEMIIEQDRKGRAKWWFNLSNDFTYRLKALARIINNHLNREETK